MTEYYCEATVNQTNYQFQTLAAVTVNQAYSQFDKYLFDEHLVLIELAKELTFKKIPSY